MADRPPYPERDALSPRGPATGTPRWVKVSGVIALAVLLLLLILLLVGGNHGPSRHQSTRGLGGPLPMRAVALERR